LGKVHRKVNGKKGSYITADPTAKLKIFPLIMRSLIP
jgi:hypothetical protein